MGVPPSQYEFVFDRTNVLLGAADPEYVPPGGDIRAALIRAGLDLTELMRELAAYRRTHSGDDLTSVLVGAQVDGESLTPEELAGFFNLLLVAGNETTRNLIALGTLALIDHPKEFAKLRQHPELLPSAVEEMLRYTSPVTHMARQATADIEIRGQLIKRGDTVVMLYGAANRDEDVFGATAEDFDIARSPNPHIAFGCGEHACLGAQLARLEARVMFEVLLGAYPSIELAGDVTRLRATMVPGVKRMPVRLGTR
jgi:cytochrome P450